MAGMEARIQTGALPAVGWSVLLCIFSNLVLVATFRSLYRDILFAGSPAKSKGRRRPADSFDFESVCNEIIAAGG